MSRARIDIVHRGAPLDPVLAPPPGWDRRAWETWCASPEAPPGSCLSRRPMAHELPDCAPARGCGEARVSSPRRGITCKAWGSRAKRQRQLRGTRRRAA